VKTPYKQRLAPVAKWILRPPSKVVDRTRKRKIVGSIPTRSFGWNRFLKRRGQPFWFRENVPKKPCLFGSVVEHLSCISMVRPGIPIGGKSPKGGVACQPHLNGNRRSWVRFPEEAFSSNSLGLEILCEGSFAPIAQLVERGAYIIRYACRTVTPRSWVQAPLGAFF